MSREPEPPQSPLAAEQPEVTRACRGGDTALLVDEQPDVHHDEGLLEPEIAEADYAFEAEPPVAPAAPGIRPATFITVTAVLFGLLVAAVGGGIVFYTARIAPRLQTRNVPPPAAPPAVNLAPLQEAVADAAARVAELQTQLQSERDARQQSERRVEELSNRLSELVLKHGSVFGGAAVSRAPKADASNVPSVAPALSPTVSELVLLKERNRLAGYADEAIATGRRDALQAIVEAMFDPAVKQLHHAAQAEFKRVQSYYSFSVSIDPGYTLPVSEMFKGPAVRSEKDLTPSQLAKILLDHQLPWEARLRSAFLLRSSTEADTDRALLRALKEDPSLDVAKQAQTTFEKRVGRSFRLFDIPAIEVWWQMQGNLLLAPPSDKK